jgi:regulator of sigma E protease
MIDSPGFLWTIACFILLIGPLVFVHELGHFLVARFFGVKVEAFSIGFGREILGWTDRLGTRWKFGWLPLGGYVRFAGDMNGASVEDARWRDLPAEERAQVFHAKPVWQRALIVLAGPITNLIAAVVILAGFALVYGEAQTPPVIATVQKASPADLAGLQPGDRILDVNGRSIDSFDQIYPMVQDRPGERLNVLVDRDGAKKKFELVPASVRQTDRFGNEYRIGRIGIGAAADRTIRPVSLLEAPLIGLERTVSILDRMVTGLWQLISGRRSVQELGGPIKIAQISGEAAVLGLPQFIYLAALISINLGFINLLPVPMLDGGHLTFYAIEAIQRRPVSPRTMEIAFRSGMYALLALMAFVTLNDLASLGLWRLAGLDG